MSPDEARARLAARQAELVRGLAGYGPAPADFDPARVRAAAGALLSKRTREAARAWPRLAESLGEAFRAAFAAYAEAVPYPARGGPLADGRAFAAHLADRGRLTPAGEVEAVHFDLYFARTPDGAVRRRTPWVIVRRLKRSRRLVLAARLPWLGERWLSVRL